MAGMIWKVFLGNCLSRDIKIIQIRFNEEHTKTIDLTALSDSFNIGTSCYYYALEVNACFLLWTVNLVIFVPLSHNTT